jgi:hypothetical protein
VKPKILTQSAFFVRWDAVSTRTGPCLTMTVIPEITEPTQKPTPLTIMVPNKENTRGLAPPESVEMLSGQLRVGDKVSVTYQKSGLNNVYKSASREAGGANAADSGSNEPGAASGDTNDTFVFVRAQKIRLGPKSYDAVVAARGTLSCVFLMADAEAKEALMGPPAPADGLAEKVKACQRGAKVRLKYQPHKYFFWLQDMEVLETEEATAKAG